jgi:simple sugar transport system substrate-binding protein
MHTVKALFAAALSAATFGISPPAAAQGTPPFKVAYVYVSPISDAGWTFQHDSGRKQMESALAGKVATKYVENVPEGADAERVIRELAQSGNQLIFTTSFGYMNPTLKVAKAFRIPGSSTRLATRPTLTSARTTHASTKAAISPARLPAG